MTKHTPGPWRDRVASGDAARVITGPPGTSSVCEVPYRFADPETRAANARLIATAPELLASLKEVVVDCCWCEVKERALAAITKAEGGRLGSDAESDHAVGSARGGLPVGKARDERQTGGTPPLRLSDELAKRIDEAIEWLDEFTDGERDQLGRQLQEVVAVLRDAKAAACSVEPRRPATDAHYSSAVLVDEITRLREALRGLLEEVAPEYEQRKARGDQAFVRAFEHAKAAL